MISCEARKVLTLYFALTYAYTTLEHKWCYLHFCESLAWNDAQSNVKPRVIYCIYLNIMSLKAIHKSKMYWLSYGYNDIIQNNDHMIESLLFFLPFFSSFFKFNPQYYRRRAQVSRHLWTGHTWLKYSPLSGVCALSCAD